MKKVYKVTDLNQFQITMLLFISKIPYLIAYYPGFMIWDTASSIAQFYGFKTHVVSISPMPDAILSNHHMILFTYLMGGFVKFGELIGSQNFGFFSVCYNSGNYNKFSNCLWSVTDKE